MLPLYSLVEHILFLLSLQVSATMEPTTLMNLVNKSVTAMPFTMIAPSTEQRNMTTLLIEDNITSSILLDKQNNATSPYDNNITSTLDELLLPSIVNIVHDGLCVVCSLLAIFGNLLTIIAVARFEILRNSTSYFICSLAIADIIGGLLLPIGIAYRVLIDDPIYIPLCLVHKFLSLLSTANNVLSILWIAVDRYIFIARPLHYCLIVTSTRTFLVIGFTWLITTIEVAVVFAVGQSLKMGMTCKYSIFLTKMVYNNIILPQLLVLFPVTVSFYIAIGCIAYKQGKKIAALNKPYDTYEATTNRQQKRIAKMMIMVLGTYSICLIPQNIASILQRVYPDSMLILVLEKITVFIFWTDTWINPIIYAWKSKDFRLAFRKLFGMKANNVAPFDATIPLGNI